jgi:flagellar biosynthesis protein FlhF
MRIKSFTAPTQRQAMELVRQELGDEAVILSTREVESGYEIAAAIDTEEQWWSTPSSEKPQPIAGEDTPKKSAASKSFTHPKARVEESTHAHQISQMFKEVLEMKSLLEGGMTSLLWQEYGRHKPEELIVMKRLLGLGLGGALVKKVLARLSHQKADDAWTEAQQVLVDLLSEDPMPILETGGRVAFVGPTGVGKTTSIAKLASRFLLRHGQHSLALVTTDKYRVGAIEQLKVFADLMQVPLYVAGDQLELYECLRALRTKKLVLIDTAGMSQRDIRLSEQLTASLHIEGMTIRNYLVISAATQLSVIDEIIQSFSRIPLSGVVLSKLDEANRMGQVITGLIEHQLPMSYLCNGQRVPEDIRVAYKRDVVEMAVTSAGRTAEQSIDEELMALIMGREIPHGR